MDPLTYKHPRTLKDAFGEGGPIIDPEDPPMDWQDKTVLWAAPVVVIFLVVLFALEAV
jgi:hypothetical protein